MHVIDDEGGDATIQLHEKPLSSGRKGGAKQYIPFEHKSMNIYSKLEKRKEKCQMKNVIITIVLIAIAIGLIVGVIVPIAQHGRTTAATAKTSMTGIDTNITSLSIPIQ